MAKQKSLPWIPECTRRFMIGFHVPDYDQVPDYPKLQKEYDAPDILANVDPRAFVRELKKAHIQAFWFYSKCHFGNAYYPSRVGHVHSALNGRDLFGEMVEACRSEGIVPLCVYEFSDNRMRKDHPDWCHKIPGTSDFGKVDITDATQGARIGGPCLNGPYGEFVMEQTREVLKAYPIKGYYVDFLGLFSPETWICPYCAPSARKAIGREFKGADSLSHAEYVRYIKWYYAQNERYGRQMSNLIRQMRPDVAFTHNAHMKGDDVGMQRFGFASRNCDFLSADMFHLRSGMLQMSTNLRLFAAGSRHLPAEALLDSMVCMTGDLVTVKAPGSYNAELWTARSNNVATCTSSYLNIDGTVNPEILGLIRKLYSEHRQYEPWLRDMETVAHVGLVRDHNSLEFTPGEKEEETFVHHPYHGHEYAGWAQGLIASHQLWHVVAEGQLTDENLKRFRVLILPSVSCMHKNDVAAVDRFVKNGGTLIASGETSLYDQNGRRKKDFQLAKVFGAHWAGRRSQDLMHLELTDRDWRPEAPHANKVIHLMEGQLAVRAARTADVLGEIRIKPPVGLVNISVPTGKPGIIRHRYGRGTCYYFAGLPGLQYRFFGQHTCNQLMKKTLSEAMGRQAAVALEGPDSVELFAHRQKGENHLVVNLVNTFWGLSRSVGTIRSRGGRVTAVGSRFDEIEEMPELSEVTLIVRKRGRKTPAKAWLAPNGKTLRMTKKGTDYRVKVRDVGVHEMVVVEYK